MIWIIHSKIVITCLSLIRKVWRKYCPYFIDHKPNRRSSERGSMLASVLTHAGWSSSHSLSWKMLPSGFMRPGCWRWPLSIWTCPQLFFPSFGSSWALQKLPLFMHSFHSWLLRTSLRPGMVLVSVIRSKHNRQAPALVDLQSSDILHHPRS